MSLRSKGDVNVNAIAVGYGGGGHKNASGCSLTGDVTLLRKTIEAQMVGAVTAASSAAS